MALVETHKLFGIIKEHGVDEKTANAIVDAIAYSRKDLMTEEVAQTMEWRLKTHVWVVSAAASAFTIGILSLIIIFFD